MAFNTKQELFVLYYLGEAKGNATQAARLAGYKQPRQQGHRLLTNVDIAARVQAKVTSVAMTADEVLHGLASHARINVGPYITTGERPIRNPETGEIVSTEPYLHVDIEQMTDDGYGHWIKAVKHTPFGPCVEFVDGQTALVHLGRYHKLFTDKTDISGELKGPIVILSGVSMADL